MNGIICPVCGKGRLVTEEGEYQTRFVDRDGLNKPLVLRDLRRQECHACGEAFLDDSATRRLDAARRVAMGLLSADEIRQIRRKLGMTQIQICRLMGIGEKTYCRWETGAYVQTVAYDNYLRLVRELPQVVELLIQIQGGSNIRPTEATTQRRFPSLRDASSILDAAETFTQLLEKGQLLAA